MMSDNCLRQSLVTVFSCAECGDTLRLSYDGKKAVGKRIDGYDGKRGSASNVGQTPDGSDPTGAAMVKNHVFIEPCRVCLRPVKEISGAMAVLIKAASTAGEE